MGRLACAVFLATRSLVLVGRGVVVAAVASALGSDSIFARVWCSRGVSSTPGFLAYVFLSRWFRAVQLRRGCCFPRADSSRRLLDQPCCLAQV